MIDPRIFEFFKLVAVEHERIVIAQSYMHSPHEAYGLISEKFVEFFNEVRQNNSSVRKYAMLICLVQIASLCMRTAIDLMLMEDVSKEYGMKNGDENGS